MGRSEKGWELRFKWAVHSGYTHPEFTYDSRPDSREGAVESAWHSWDRKNQGMTLIGIHVRELPGGEWEHVLPVTTATCETPPSSKANTGASDTEGEGS